MIPEEIRKKIRQIQIHSRRVVNASFSGQYESVFKGRGMQFDEVREYSPGDDIRTIDWNVTARTGKAHIKRFVEEREMTVILAVDLSASGDFGTVDKTKNELAAEFCAVLAFAAAKNNDKVGLLIFSDQVEMFIPPKKGSRHVLRLIRELLYFKMPQRKTNISMALDYLSRITRKKATIFLVSDFIDSGFKKPLRLLNKRHDVIATTVFDKAEKALPDVGLVEFQDAETGQFMFADTSSNFLETYRNNNLKRMEELKTIFNSTGVDFININTDGPYINDLIKFFHMRHRRY